MIEEGVTLTEREFNSLPEYSCSLPTGTTIGRKWKRQIPYKRFPGVTPQWYLCEYVDISDPKNVGITYRKIVAIVRLKKYKEVEQ